LRKLRDSKMIKKRNKKKRQKLNCKDIIRESCLKKMFQFEENNQVIFSFNQEFKNQIHLEFSRSKIYQPYKMK